MVETKKPITLGDEEYFKVILGVSLSSNDPSLWGGETPYILPRDLPREPIVSEILNTHKSLSKLGLKKLGPKLLPENSIIVGSIGSVGRVAINKVPSGISKHVFGLLIKDKSKLSLHYVAHMIASLKSQMKYFLKGSAIPYISAKDFKSLSIPLLDINMQKLIVSKIDRN